MSTFVFCLMVRWPSLVPTSGDSHAHYYHHVPFVEIASQLGVTKGRVSQLHKRALERLRALLGNRMQAEY